MGDRSTFDVDERRHMEHGGPLGCGPVAIPASAVVRPLAADRGACQLVIAGIPSGAKHRPHGTAKALGRNRFAGACDTRGGSPPGICCGEGG